MISFPHVSVVQRKVLTPNDFHSLAKLEEALLAFQQRYEKSAAPFQWTFTREDLAKLMIRLRGKTLAMAAWTPAKYVTVIPNDST